ncbi:hypothetical protein HDZ31DRAFT_30081 [Schizophyllum fasciatum]
MAKITKPLPLVLILQEPGPEIDHNRYIDWYNNEHGPRRLTVDGFLTAARWKAVDGKKPTWLTLYDIASEDVADSPAYQAAVAQGSANERDILQKLEFGARRLYRFLSARTHPGAAADALPGRVVLAVWMDVEPGAEAEFNRWYDEEHLVMLEKVPGWLRGRRYTYVDGKSRGTLPGGEAQYKYLALHEFSRGGFMETAELKAALSTPWRDEVAKHVTARDLRVFELDVVYEKPRK